MDNSTKTGIIATIAVVAVLVSIVSFQFMTPEMDHDDLIFTEKFDKNELRKIAQSNVNANFESVMNHGEITLYNNNDQITDFVGQLSPEGFMSQMMNNLGEDISVHPAYLEAYDSIKKENIVFEGLIDEPYQPVMEILKSGKGTWIHFEIENTKSKIIEKKQAWVKMHEKLIVGSAFTEKQYLIDDRPRSERFTLNEIIKQCTDDDYPYKIEGATWQNSTHTIDNINCSWSLTTK